MNDKSYGEGIYPWTALEQPKRMKELIVSKCGPVSQADQAEDCLHRAIPYYHDRNHLAHGEWWAFDQNAGTVTVRRGRRFANQDQHRSFSLYDIAHIASALSDIEVELYKLKASIKAFLKRDWD